MPLKNLLEKHGKWLENGFWLVIFIVAFVAMNKVMHPGWTILGF